jgi:hypothetical protein
MRTNEEKVNFTLIIGKDAPKEPTMAPKRRGKGMLFDINIKKKLEFLEKM